MARRGCPRRRDDGDRGGPWTVAGPHPRSRLDHHRGGAMTHSALVSIDWLAVAPVLAPAGGAVVALVLDAALPRALRAHAPVAVLALVVGIACAVPGVVRSASQPWRTLCLAA